MIILRGAAHVKNMHLVAVTLIRLRERISRSQFILALRTSGAFDPLPRLAWTAIGEGGMVKRVLSFDLSPCFIKLMEADLFLTKDLVYMVVVKVAASRLAPGLGLCCVHILLF